MGALVLAPLAGCDVINPPICTLMDAIPGVTFVVPTALVPDAAASYRLRACADASCLEWDTHGGEPTMNSVVLPSGDWPGWVTARLTITHIDAATSVDEVVFDASTSLEVTLYEPNGPGCEPRVFMGSARATADGDLEANTRDS